MLRDSKKIKKKKTRPKGLGSHTQFNNNKSHFVVKRELN